MQNVYFLQKYVDLSKHVTLYWQQMVTGGGRGNLYGAKYAAFFLQPHAV
jgi:hypothetical protein